jgi:hypothetical protein
MTGTIRDEELMAYADGELSGADHERIARAIESDPRLRERLVAFARTGQSLGQAFEPAPRPIPAALRGRETKAAGARPWRGWFGGWSELFRPQAALAAIMLLLILGGAALLQFSSVYGPSGGLIVSRDGALIASGALAAALETQPSASAQPDAAPIAVHETFRDRDGAYCREYALHGGDAGGRARGVACRAAGGAWTVALHVKDGGQPGSEVYTSAGGGARPLIDGYVHDAMAGAPLTADEEAELIGRGWR